jgi:hypothetical protein
MNAYLSRVAYFRNGTVYEAHEDVDFKNDFNEASKIINDNTKAYRRYTRWSKIFESLPQGSYLSCTLPNSYWRLIHDKNFNEVVVDFLSI